MKIHGKISAIQEHIDQNQIWDWLASLNPSDDDEGAINVGQICLQDYWRGCDSVQLNI